MDLQNLIEQQTETTNEIIEIVRKLESLYNDLKTEYERVCNANDVLVKLIGEKNDLIEHLKAQLHHDRFGDSGTY